MDKNNIGTRIAELRKSKNLSQSDLAQKLCVSNKTISKWECGNGTPDIEMLSKMSKIFGITLDEMVNQTTKTENPKEKVLEDKEQSIENKTISKKSLIGMVSSIILTIVLCASIFCYFFIPREPIIKTSNFFEIDQNNSTLYCTVENDKTVLSLNDQFKVPLTNKWGLYYDLNGTREISSKIVNLQIGDNTFYLIVENSANNKKVYTLTIRRKPMYVVTFDTNGGISIANQIVMEGEFAKLVTPERTGYIFSSWDYDFTKPITQNTTIKASWIAKNLKIVYYSNNSSENSITQNVTYDTTAKLKDNNIFTKKGYTLSSWNTKPDGTGISYETGKEFKNYNIPSDLNLYAQWTINQYQIQCDKNIEGAGTIDGNGFFNYNTQHTLSVRTNAGYTWLGYFKQDGTLITESLTLTITLSDCNYNCIAKWVANNYFCSLDVNGGNALTENNKTITFGQSFNLPVPTRTEAVFDGWYYDNVQYTNNLGISVKNWDIPSSATLYAKWSINKYLVSLTTNNANGGNVIGNGSYEYNSEVLIKAETNQGYSFGGWYENNILLSSDVNFTFTMPNYNKNITAKWQANSYNVTLDSMGGTMDEPDNCLITYDSAYSLPIPYKTGYSFDGWFTKPNKSGTKLTSNDGQAINKWNIAENVTIFAAWDIINYTISYELNYGKLNIPNISSYNIESDPIVIQNPTREGFDFVGWIGTDITEPIKNLILPTGSFANRVYGAKWVKNSSFVAIASVSDLQNIANNPSGNYYLTGDIDFEGLCLDSALFDENQPFTGVFDGNYHSIKNLASSHSLFGINNGTIINLKFENYNMSGSKCFPIAETNNGTISYCSLNLQISGQGELGGSGYGAGFVKTNNGLIEYCRISGSIAQNFSTKDHSSFLAVYGFANKNTGKISNCYSSAGLSSYNGSNGASYVYGFVNTNEGEITHCYAVGNMRASGKYPQIYSFWYGMLDATEYGCYISEKSTIEETQYTNTGGVITTKVDTVTKSDQLLLDASYTKFYNYNEETDFCLNKSNCWYYNDNEYPILFWEKDQV